MDYTILILALPMLSFLLLALAGMKMPHRVAGAIGTLSLGVVAVLSYLTAFSYFTAPRTAEGLYPTLLRGTLNGCRSLRLFILTWVSCWTRFPS